MYYSTNNNFISVFLLFSQSMELVGGNEVKLSPAMTANMSYVFPNKVKHNNNLLVIINGSVSFVLSLH